MSVEVLQSRALRAKFVTPEGATDYVEMPRGHSLSRIPVPKGMEGQSFGTTDFRRITHLSVLTIVRQDDGRESRMLAEADVVLRADDGLIVMGRDEDVRKYGGNA